MRNPITILAVVAVLAGSLVGVPLAHAAPDSQTRAQALTEKYSKKLEAARPYPLGAVDDSGERANLTERLLRLNNPNKIGYVALVAHTGQIIATFTIKGKVSSTASQITNTHNMYYPRCGETKDSDHCPVAVDSMGDDGSYGPEEGGEHGVFFFTAQGVLIEWNGHWKYSDAPINIVSAPMVQLPANAQPSTNEHHLLGDGQQ